MAIDNAGTGLIRRGLQRLEHRQPALNQATSRILGDTSRSARDRAEAFQAWASLSNEATLAQFSAYLSATSRSTPRPGPPPGGVRRAELDTPAARPDRPAGPPAGGVRREELDDSPSRPTGPPPGGVRHEELDDTPSRPDRPDRPDRPTGPPSGGVRHGER